MDMFQMLAQAKALLGTTRKAVRQIGAISSDQRGVSAIEFSLFAGLLSVGLLNTVDLSFYIYKRMELENATQMAGPASYGWIRWASW